MAIVHGAAGIEYYCHRMEPTLNETNCLDVVPIRNALTEINAAITGLAPVLNTQSVANGVSVVSSNAQVPVDTMLKRYGGATYLFAVAMRSAATGATFQLGGIPETASAEVLGEGRTIEITASLVSRRLRRVRRAPLSHDLLIVSILGGVDRRVVVRRVAIRGGVVRSLQRERSHRKAAASCRPRSRSGRLGGC